MDVESMIGQKRKNIHLFQKRRISFKCSEPPPEHLYMGSIMKTYEGVEVQEVANDPRTQDAPEES